MKPRTLAAALVTNSFRPDAGLSPPLRAGMGGPPSEASSLRPPASSHLWPLPSLTSSAALATSGAPPPRPGRPPDCPVLQAPEGGPPPLKRDRPPPGPSLTSGPSCQPLPPPPRPLCSLSGPHAQRSFLSRGFDAAQGTREHAEQTRARQPTGRGAREPARHACPHAFHQCPAVCV